MKEPTIHDTRAYYDVYECDDYLERVVKSVNPHNSPKNTLQKLFPSAKVSILKGNTIISENKEWTCSRGCDLESPILSFELNESVINMNLKVVTRIKCTPVLTCPICMSQEVEEWKGC